MDQSLSQVLEPFIKMFGIWFLPLLVWSAFWKGVALWRAAQLGQKKWFIALFIVNTFGIIEILYLYVFSKSKEEKNKTGL